MAKAIEATRSRIARVWKAVKTFLEEDASADATHALRTSIRRLSIAASLLPKRARREGELAAFLDACDTLRDACAPIRDADVGSSLIGEFPAEVRDAMTAAVEPDKARTIEEAKARAKEVLALGRPKVKRRRVSKKKLRARRAERAEELLVVAGERFRAILDRPSPARVHAARKSARKLRYALEIVSGTDDPRVVELAKVQEGLGALHDRDVLLARLRTLERTPEIARAIAETAAARKASAAITAEEDAPSPRRAPRRRSP